MLAENSKIFNNLRIKCLLIFLHFIVNAFTIYSHPERKHENEKIPGHSKHSFCLLLMIYPSITTAEENKNILTFEELSIKVMPEFAYHPNDEKKEHPRY